MLKHENPNIEIINHDLWAVRFSLIPLIPQISYNRDPAIPLERVPGQMTADGIMVLNKDFKYYDYLRKVTVTVMKMNKHKIHNESVAASKLTQNKPERFIYRYCLMAELERRKIKKGGAT